jgi:nicotinic acid phosphoribosyltransferase
MKTQQKIAQFEQNPPENLERFTDIYFTWSRETAEMQGLEQEFTKIIHAGPEAEAEVSGLQEAAEIYDRMTNEEVDIYLSEKESFDSREPLMIVEGPLTQVLEPETPVLGTLSHHLTEANQDLGYEHVDPEEYGEGAVEITEMLEGLNEELGLEGRKRIGLADFGARHYHPALQRDLAQQAYSNGAIGHSTQAGVEAINEMLEGDEMEPSGTMPHAFVLGQASRHGMEHATFGAFKAYEDVVDGATPVLIDTNNSERDDTLEICEYMEQQYGEDFDLVVRMDTNGANHAQTVPEDERRPGNKGMSVEAVRGMSEALREEGYRDNVTFLISSGMGKTEKLQEFVDAAETYHEKTGELMFDGVGAGSFDTTNNLYTTSDIVKAGDEWLGKKGRLEELKSEVDADLEAYREENMVKYEPVRAGAVQ